MGLLNLQLQPSGADGVKGRGRGAGGFLQAALPRLSILLSVNVFQGPDQCSLVCMVRGLPARNRLWTKGGVRAVPQSGFADEAGEQTPGVCELPKLEGTLRPQYLAGGRFLGPSLLFNAHRKQNRPTPDIQVANIITRACRDPSQGRTHELGPPRFENASSAFKRHPAQACSL